MDLPFKTWQCRTCGYVYDEALGAADEGLAPGTRWQDVPATWKCPECGTAKSDFDMGELEF
jgi:rubredoxin